MVQNVSDFVKIAGHTVERATLSGLKSASAKSGVSFQYLVAKAAQESSLKTDAMAKTSSAKGLFQFTQGTWLDMMDRFGERYGYGDLAAKISVGTDGKATVDDPIAKRRILDMRKDPEASALMAAEYALGNAQSLHNTLGRDPDAADLYLAHFLGASGSSRLLTAAADSPGASAASLLPAAANANTSVFYTPDGRARTVAEVAELVRGRFSDQMDRYQDVASTWTDQGATLPATQRTPARTSNTDFNALDFKGNMSGSNTYATAVSWVVLEEMAKLIASSPMNMFDSGENDDESDKDPYATSSPGFQGQDFASALMQSVRASETSPNDPRRAPSPDHQRSAAAYEARFAPTAAPRMTGQRGQGEA